MWLRIACSKIDLHYCCRKQTFQLWFYEKYPCSARNSGRAQKSACQRCDRRIFLNSRLTSLFSVRSWALWCSGSGSAVTYASPLWSLNPKGLQGTPSQGMKKHPSSWMMKVSQSTACGRWYLCEQRITKTRHCAFLHRAIEKNSQSGLQRECERDETQGPSRTLFL